MIKIILFDVGSTLVDPHPSSREIIVQVLNANGAHIDVTILGQAEPVSWQAVAHLVPFHRYDREESAAFWDAFYVALLDNVGVPHDFALRRKIHEEFQRLETWRLYPDAITVITELRRRGYRIGIVSNWEEWLEDLLLALDIHSLFDVIVASGPFGRAKPHPSIFEEALLALGGSPSEAVHVGDNPRDDVGGARALGIRPILIDRQNRFPDLNVERIASLTEILSLVP